MGQDKLFQIYIFTEAFPRSCPEKIMVGQTSGLDHPVTGFSVYSCSVIGVIWSHRAHCIVKTILGNAMSRKKLIMIGMIVGSIVGGYAPSLFGVDGIVTSLLGSTAGGILGIWIAYRLS